MKPAVGIIDYGMGNLFSVHNTIKALGFDSDIVNNPSNLLCYDRLILPGVGAFGDAMRELKKKNLIEDIKRFISAGKPFLGICLGMHLLFENSQESKGINGLGIIKGSVRRFSSKLKCPHIGWNQIKKINKSPLNIYKGTASDIYAYFCHSYYVVPKKKSVCIGMTDYGINFASIVKQDNVYGMQFHPEKSQDTGLKLLENFIRFC